MFKKPNESGRSVGVPRAGTITCFWDEWINRRRLVCRSTKRAFSRHRGFNTLLTSIDDRDRDRNQRSLLAMRHYSERSGILFVSEATFPMTGARQPGYASVGLVNLEQLLPAFKGR